MTETTVPTRHRASLGRYFEDFAVGDVYEHFPGRTITEADNIQFSLLTMNNHPMHCDHAFAARSEFGKPLVNSGLTLAIVLGMTVQKELARISTHPDARERLLQLGAEPVLNTPAEFAAFTQAEYAKFAKIIKTAGIQPE